MTATGEARHRKGVCDRWSRGSSIFGDADGERRALTCWLTDRAPKRVAISSDAVHASAEADTCFCTVCRLWNF